MWICFVVMSILTIGNLALYFLDSQDEKWSFESQAMTFGTLITFVMALMTITFVRDRLIQNYPREMSRIVYMMKDDSPHFTRYKTYK